MWYRTGTVTLKKGTNKVLGIGTKWQDKLSNVEAGQPLIIDGNIYEITEVRSDTELYLKESALEDTTDSNYVIMSVVYGSLGDVALKASKALAHYQEQMDTFDMMYTGTQPFKVTKPDGTEIEMYPYSMLSVNLAQINDAIQKTATSATDAKASEISAKNSATSAATSATSASNSAITAETSASATNLSATNAKTSETNAAKSATAAASSATSASTSASNAKTSETNAKNYADSINPDGFLSKNKNFEDVPDKLKALANLNVAGLDQKNTFNNNQEIKNADLNMPALKFIGDRTNFIGGFSEDNPTKCRYYLGLNSQAPTAPLELVRLSEDEINRLIGYVRIYPYGDIIISNIGGKEIALNPAGRFTHGGSEVIVNNYQGRFTAVSHKGVNVKEYSNSIRAASISSESGYALLWQHRDVGGVETIDSFIGLSPTTVPTVRIKNVDSEMLHTGNACVYNGVGVPVTLLMGEHYFILGQNYTGNAIGIRSSNMGNLSGTWTCVSLDAKYFGAQLFIAVTLKRIF